MSVGSDSPVNRREVAYRLFAAEYDDADLEYSDSDEERAPNYVITPSGARVNRLFVVGVLTEVESVSDDVLRGRVVDPTGAFVTYAGQYQPDAKTFLERAEPPMFVAVTGKARTFRPDGSDRVLTSVRPESINEVDAETRDRWTVQAAAHTIDRVETVASALERPERGDDLRDRLLAAGVDAGLAAGVPLAIDHYGTTTGYLSALRRISLEAAEVVAGDRDEVSPVDVAPAEGGEAPVPTADLDLDLDVDHDEADPASASPGDAEAQPGALEAAGGSEGGAGASAGSSDSAGTGAGGADADDSAEGTPPTPAAGSDGDDVDDAPHVSVAAEEEDGEPATEQGAAPDTDGAAAETEATVPAGAGDDLGDFDAYGGTAADDGDAAETGESSADPGELYEFDEGERAEIEAEYGTEFSTGTEVDAPGEADIDVPTGEEATGDSPTADAESAEAPDPDAPDASGAPPDTQSEAEASTAEEGEPEPDPEEMADEGATDEEIADEAEPTAAEAEPDPADEDDEGDASGAPEDLEDAVVASMRDLDDGDGADRAAVIDAVAGANDVSADAVEDAIQDALMSGKCYEPSEDRLKAI